MRVAVKLPEAELLMWKQRASRMDMSVSQLARTAMRRAGRRIDAPASPPQVHTNIYAGASLEKWQEVAEASGMSVPQCIRLAIEQMR